MADDPTGGTFLPTRRSTWAWIAYDLANTIFALGVIGLYFPAWLVAEGHPDSYLAGVEAAAGIVVVFVAPWAGARSDSRGRRVPTLRVTTLVAVGATLLLAGGPLSLTFAALGLALVAFNTGSVVYDALLADVSTPGDRGRVSGLGVGVGYVGSIIGLAIGAVTLDWLDLGYAITFRTLGIAFLVCALPAFFMIRERPRPSTSPVGIHRVIGRIVVSWRLARTIPGMVRFLVGRFLYTDAINTLIGGFLAIYAIDELGLDAGQTRNLLAVAIAAAIPGGVVAGRAVERFGSLAVLRAVLVAWLIALAVGIVAGLTDLTSLAWAIGALGGAALGGTWAADRVLMNELSPAPVLGEMYGLYATVGRFATILGPLVWAVVVDVLGLARPWALGALALFVAAALVVLAGLGSAGHIRRASPT